MENLPNCPKCNSEYTYEDGSLLVCSECAYEWSQEASNEEENVIKDVNGNVLNDGDSVTVVKDLKVKGASSSIKIGTKVKINRKTEDKGKIEIEYYSPEELEKILAYFK